MDNLMEFVLKNIGQETFHRGRGTSNKLDQGRHKSYRD